MRKKCKTKREKEGARDEREKIIKDARWREIQKCERKRNTRM
jgi:hypothetical protein